jgi:hypothetical protein
MINMDDIFRNTKVSKGGVLGALLGGIASFKVHRNADSPLKKTGKTVALTGIGYLLGQWIENRLKSK